MVLASAILSDLNTYQGSPSLGKQGLSPLLASGTGLVGLCQPARLWVHTQVLSPAGQETVWKRADVERVVPHGGAEVPQEGREVPQKGSA